MGGQFGSEGKGEIAAYLAKKNDYHISVRTGGPNAGHTVHWYGNSDSVSVKDSVSDDGSSVWQMNGKLKTVFRHVPCAAINPKTTLFMGPGSLLDLQALDEELEHLETCGIRLRDRFNVDYGATIISEADKRVEREGKLREKNGSTLEGVGSARARHLMRQGAIIRNVSGKWLDEKGIHLVPVPDWLGAVRDEQHVKCLIESTQGFGLSLDYSGFYPQTTSANLVPTEILSAAGFAAVPHNLNVIMVMRTFPIRVAGNSGPMAGELTWEEISEMIGRQVTEQTTVTKLTRRVGAWDEVEAIRTGQICKPDSLALTFMDYLIPEIHGLDGDNLERKLNEDEQVERKVRRITEKTEDQVGCSVTMIGTGPGNVTEVEQLGWV